MVIGLIGGVGSGKSMVLDYLERQYNAYIIQADTVAKEVMAKGGRVYNRVVEAFPEAVVDNDIDNEKLSKYVFADKDKLKQLNNMTHPGTIEEIIARITEYEEPLIVVESALLLGTEVEKYCDEIWFVFCEKEARIQRVIENRGYTREKAESIMKNQPTDEEYNQKADELIDNSYSEEKTKEQIDLILSETEC